MRHVVILDVVGRLCDRKLDGHVNDPVAAVALQPELPGVRITLNEFVPEVRMLRVNAERYPEVGPVAGLRDPPVNS